MKIIDIHTHVYPAEIAQKATQSVQTFYEIDGGGMNGTVKMLLERGSTVGITQYVILPVAIRPDRVNHINDFILQQAKEKDCLIPFGTIHAAMDHLTDEVERIINCGVKGIKMHPDCQRFCIDDPRLFAMYEAISGKIPVMLHMGDLRYDYSQPSRLRHVLDLFPNLETVAAHFGGYRMYEAAYEQLNDKNCIFDISSSIMFMDEGIPEKYINMYGAERMAYGTDYPLWDPVQEVQRFQQLKLTDDQFEQIAYKTATRFLKL